MFAHVVRGGLHHLKMFSLKLTFNFVQCNPVKCEGFVQFYPVKCFVQYNSVKWIWCNLGDVRQAPASTATFNNFNCNQLQLQPSTASLKIPALISSLIFQLQLLASTASFNCKLQLQASTASFICKLHFTALTSIFKCKLPLQVLTCKLDYVSIIQ